MNSLQGDENIAWQNLLIVTRLSEMYDGVWILNSQILSITLEDTASLFQNKTIQKYLCLGNQKIVSSSGVVAFLYFLFIRNICVEHLPLVYRYLPSVMLLTSLTLTCTANIVLFKVNNKDVVFIVVFEHI